MDRREALQAIAACVGPPGVVDADADGERYLIDHRRQYQGQAAMIVRPADVASVAEVVRLAAGAGLAVVPQGGNTGYCGGATPGIDGQGTGERTILLSLERLRGIRQVDPVGYSMTVEAGAVLADVQAAAEREGMLFPLSLGSEGSCQIGGNLATNAGGTAVLRYGNARELVLGVEVVLADGQIWNGLRELRKDNAGYDLKQLFLGAEGTLGIITAAVLKLFPLPRERATALVAVTDVDAACQLLSLARRESADAVTSFEYLPRFALELVATHIEGGTNPLADANYHHYVLVELSSAAPEARLEARLEHLLAKGHARGWVRDAVVAQSEAQRQHLWRLRENVPEAQRLAGGSFKHDVSVPIPALAAFLAQGLAGAAAAAPDARPCVYGHIGDGNLHFNFMAPQGEGLAEHFEGDRGAQVSAAVLDAAAAHGGSVCAEHGVGYLKRPLLAGYQDAVSIDLMRRVKAALDPEGTLNPHKVIPDDPGGGE
ncbi:MAG: FAD-binding oxidoreductase [Pseudomonadota bacterium]